MSLVAAICTQCGAQIEVDNTHEAGICQHCGTAFITEKVINNYRIHANNIILNGENIKVSEYDIEEGLKAASKFMENNYYYDAEKILTQIVEKWPYDYRGWWNLAKLEYKQGKCWFDENPNFNKSKVLCIGNSELINIISYRDKEYNKIKERDKKLIGFLENPKLSELDEIYFHIKTIKSELTYDELYVGLEVNGEDIHLITYHKDRNGHVYGRKDWGKVKIKCELEGNKFVGYVVDENDSRCWKCMRAGYTDVCITEYTNNGIVFNNQPDSTIKANFREDYENHEKARKKGCYIATCVYGSYDCPEVWTLRRFRDYTLDNTWYGRLFIKYYYAISPTLVKRFGNQNWFKAFWKKNLDHMISKLNNRGVANTEYKDKY